MTCSFCNNCIPDGSFEAHVTLGDLSQRWKFKDYVEGQGGKALFLQLYLPHGGRELQVMTSYVGHMEDLLSFVLDTKRRFTTSRVKLEKPSHRFVPGEQGYFEAHLQPVDPLVDQLDYLYRFGVRASRNINKDQEIISSRTYSLQALDRSVTVVERNFGIEKVRKEFCFHDSNPGLDSNWFPIRSGSALGELTP